MKKLVIALLIIGTLTAAAQVSYWFSGWQRSGNAQIAQQYFMMPGTNIVFTWTNTDNHVWINAANTVALATNWSGSNAMMVFILGVSNNVVVTSNFLFTLDATNSWHLDGNAIGNTNAFLGTTDNNPLKFKMNNLVMGEIRTNFSVSLGPSNITGLSAIAIGTNVTASGTNAIGIGESATASAEDSVAISAATASGQQSVAIGFAATATNVNSFALGSLSISEGVRSMAIGYQAHTTSNAPYALALGRACVVSNEASFVWYDDSTGVGNTQLSATSSNQFYVNAHGGATFNTGRNGLLVREQNSIAAATITYLTNGSFYLPRNAVIVDTTTSSNGYFYKANTNGLVDSMTNVTPLHAWGMLSGFTNASNLGVFVSPTVTRNVYYPVTNYNYIVTNLWGAFGTATNGVLTNALPGWYKCQFSVAAAGATSDQLEADLTTNGVTTDVIASHLSSGAGANVANCMSGVGVLYLPANTQVSLSIRNITATSIRIDHVQLMVSSP